MNQVLAPRLVSAAATLYARECVSGSQWTRLGVQALPVRSTDEAAVARRILFLSRVRLLTARAIAELFTSIIASTFSLSYQRRATAMPTSGLFWLSPMSISIAR